MLFTEFMAEMKRPRDFWKGMICAQGFIYVVYIVYGAVIYQYQGQYAVNPSYQGISNYGWQVCIQEVVSYELSRVISLLCTRFDLATDCDLQTAGNVIGLISALIAAGLYGNIGVKVIYNNILIDFFKAPLLSTKKGKVCRLLNFIISLQ